jgi:predicted transcriptional regulator
VSARGGAIPGEDGRPEAEWLPAPVPSKGTKSFAFQKAIRRASDLTSTQKLVLFVLSTYARHRGAEGRCWPSTVTIAREAAVSRSTVKLALRRLVALGWITVSPRRGEHGTASHEYALHVPGHR